MDNKFTVRQIDYKKRNIEMTAMHIINQAEVGSPESRINLAAKNALVEHLSKMIELHIDMFDMLVKLQKHEIDSVRTYNEVTDLLRRARGEDVQPSQR